MRQAKAQGVVKYALKEANFKIRTYSMFLETWGSFHYSISNDHGKGNSMEISFCSYFHSKWAQQIFAHAITAMLSWHVQTFVAIRWLVIEIQQGEASIELGSWANKSFMKTVLLSFILLCLFIPPKWQPLCLSINVCVCVCVCGGGGGGGGG